MLALIAVVSVALAGVGSVLRALAHENNKNQDYVGKLFAVAAAFFAIFSAVGALSPALRELAGPAVIIIAIVVIIGALIGGVWLLRGK